MENPPFLWRYIIDGQLCEPRKLKEEAKTTEVLAARNAGRSVVLKVLGFPKWEMREAAIPEAENQLRLEHPHVCKVLNYFLAEHLDRFYLVIEMERMDHDLEVESINRQKQKEPWSDSEILKCLIQLAEALQYAQEQGIAHRDVKPKNVFLHLCDYKIGDFGSSEYLLGGQGTAMLTVGGTMLFLSPEQVAALKEMISSPFRVKHLEYNPFKSDVYSLALTILAALDPSCKSRLDKNSDAIGVLEKLSICSELKSTLRWMLEFKPASRPDFHDLLRHLKTLSPQLEQPESWAAEPQLALSESLIECRSQCELTPASWKILPKAGLQYSEQRLSCLVCGKVTKTRYLQCLQHSYCSEECHSRLALLRPEFVDPGFCLVCNGTTYEAELRLLTEVRLQSERCHFCDRPGMDLNAVVYCVCGGEIRLVCSKQCLRTVYRAARERTCATCGQRLYEERLQEALLHRGWKDLPSYSSKKHCSLCLNPAVSSHTMRCERHTEQSTADLSTGATQ